MNLKILILLLTLSATTFGQTTKKESYSFTIKKGTIVKEHKQTFLGVTKNLGFK